MALLILTMETLSIVRTSTDMQSKGLSALDVVNAISVQKLILQTGPSKIVRAQIEMSQRNLSPRLATGDERRYCGQVPIAI
jgi:hypothetical protein